MKIEFNNPCVRGVGYYVPEGFRAISNKSNIGDKVYVIIDDELILGTIVAILKNGNRIHIDSGNEIIELTI